jgi:hypothetical protein
MHPDLPRGRDSVVSFMRAILEEAPANDALEPVADRTMIEFNLISHPLSRPADRRSSRPGPGAVRLSIAGLLLALLTSAPHSPGQLAPTYPELFGEPLPSLSLTPADLPNLGRLVVLEATSMFVHARQELYESPSGGRLVEDISALWVAADAFTAAVSFDSVDARRVEAGLLALPDLLAAYGRLRESVDTIPGRAYLTVRNFWDMSRVVAVLGPILREASRDLEAAGPLPPLPGDLGDLRLRSRSLATAIELMIRKLAEYQPGNELSSLLKDQLEVLRRLERGFEDVLSGQPDDRDSVSAFRPLRSLSTTINQAISRSRGPETVRNEWKNVQAQVDEIAELFRLPREIVVSVSPKAEPPPDAGILAALDGALLETESLRTEGLSTAPLLAPVPAVEADARTFRTRLLVLRQQVLGREPNTRIARSLDDVENASRRLHDRINQPGGTRASSRASSLKRIDEAVALVRRLLGGR